MNIIRAEETRNLFLTRAMMPKKNVLLRLEQICDELGKPLPKDPIERHYAHDANSKVIRKLRKYFHDHHIMFIAPKIEGVVHYGFSSNQKHLDNYMERLHVKAKTHAIIENVAKQIVNGQGLLFDNPSQKLLGQK